MSPEQTDTASAGVDTRTDVYSLGVLLYELLVGCPPFDLRRAAFSEIVRVIRTVEPPRPSASLLGRANDTAGSPTATRSTVLLARLLRRDLDWIALRALEKKCERRYSSVTEFAEDIRRFLADEPVQARRGNLLYNARKFLRRNRLRLTVAAALAVVALLSVGTWVSNTELRASEAGRSNLTRFIATIFETLHPDKRGREARVFDLLESKKDELISDLANQPADLVLLLETAGKAYSSLGIHHKARDDFERAVQVSKELLGATHERTAVLSSLLSVELAKLGEKQRANDLAHASVKILARVYEPQDPQMIEAQVALGEVLLQARVLEQLSVFLRSERRP